MRAFRNPEDFFTGLILLTIALVFGYGLLELPIGTASRMGPGYFPLILTGLLAFCALLIMANGFRGEGEPIGEIPWCGLLIITISIVLFGATLKGLGLVPSLAITVFLATFAAKDWKAAPAFVVTIVLVAVCYVTFIQGLGLPLAPFGPWIGGY